MHEIISKYIAQLRYTPTLVFYSKLFNVASTLENSDEFNHWMARRDPDQVKLFNTKKRTGLQIDSRTMSYSTEIATTGKDMSSPLAKFAALFLEDSRVEKFDHVGIRRIGIFDTTMPYKDYVEKFYKAFYSEDHGLSAITVDTVSDTLYLLEGVKDGFNTRLRIAPLKKEQLRDFFPFDEFTPEDLKLKQETSILIDMDFYVNTENDYDSSIESLALIEKSHQKAYEDVVNLVREFTVA